MADTQVERRSWSRYLFSWVWSLIGSRVNKAIQPEKKALFGGLSGRVLEFGAGYGSNFSLLNKNAIEELVVVEPNSYMFEQLKQAANGAGFAKVSVLNESLESYTDGDGTFDYVFCSLVLCSVPDVAVSVERIHRLLKPGGKFVFIEHIGCPKGTYKRWFQEFLNPVWQTTGDGCHLDRDIAKYFTSDKWSQQTTVSANIMPFPAFDGLLGSVTKL